MIKNFLRGLPTEALAETAVKEAGNSINIVLRDFGKRSPLREKLTKQTVKIFIGTGDLLYVDSIDRLGCNYGEIREEWRALTRELQVDVVALDMSELFDSRKFKAQGDIGKLLEDRMLSLPAWVAEQERKKMLQRQKEGIAQAKKAGKLKTGSRSRWTASGLRAFITIGNPE